MEYYIYIDEAGPFDNALSGTKYPSIVGGICSVHPYYWWRDNFSRLADTLSGEHSVEFEYPQHFHCAEVRHKKGFLPDVRVPGSNVTRAPKQSVKDKLTDSVIEYISENIVNSLVSKNINSRFEYSPQATYVVNLIAAVKAQFEYLAENCSDADSVQLFVAQRTIEETRQADYLNNNMSYNDALIRFVVDQVKMGETPGAKQASQLDASDALSAQMKVATNFPGLMAADFACYYMRNNTMPETAPHCGTSPNDVIFGDYRRFVDNEVTQLLNKKYYAAAGEVIYRNYSASDIQGKLKKFFEALSNEQDAQILYKELQAINNFTEYLINSRSVIDSSLESLISILSKLKALAEKQLSKAELASTIQQSWAYLYLNVLGNMCSVMNHSGSTEGQLDLEEQYNESLAKWGKLLSISRAGRKEMALEVKTANKNQLFNTYRFDDVQSSFEYDVLEREEEVEGEEDSLLGKMQGTLGQAYAFLSQRDQDYAEFAKEYFQKSLDHFEKGSVFFEMSANYQATLSWYTGNLDQACSDMSVHTDFTGENLADLDQQKMNILVSDTLSPFELLNFLRITGASDISFSSEELVALDAHWAKRIKLSQEHPTSLLAKWLGVIFLKNDSIDIAQRYFETSLNLTREKGFTIRSLAVPVYGLMLALFDIAHEGSKALRIKQEFDKELEQLCCESEDFQNVVRSTVSAAQMEQQIKDHSINEIALWLPFSYA